MTNAHIIAAVIGVFLSFTIVLLVRKDHISPMVAARWFLISLVVLIVSLQPTLIDKLGLALGVGYPPVIPILIAIGAALIKILLMDIERQKMQVKIDRLIQKMAMLEAELQGSKRQSNSDSNVTPIARKKHLD